MHRHPGSARCTWPPSSSKILYIFYLYLFILHLCVCVCEWMEVSSTHWRSLWVHSPSEVIHYAYIASTVNQPKIMEQKGFTHDWCMLPCMPRATVVGTSVETLPPFCQGRIIWSYKLCPVPHKKTRWVPHPPQSTERQFGHRELTRAVKESVVILKFPQLLLQPIQILNEVSKINRRSA